MVYSLPSSPLSHAIKSRTKPPSINYHGSAMDITTVYDCEGANLASLSIPPGVLLAGYVTGSGTVPWTAEQFAQHPTAIRIDQSPADTPADETADMIDVELEAGTIADVPGWLSGARISFHDATRPGQRWPAVYVEQSEVTPVANAIDAAGITTPVPLFLTEPMPEHAAIDMLNATGGPFPFVGIQYQFGGDHDVSVVSTAWLNNVSVAAPAPVSKPGSQTGWRFCSKCQGLFWGPGESRSVCPRGAQHNGSQSHLYTLGFAE
jgi:hypothetical protein